MANQTAQCEPSRAIRLEAENAGLHGVEISRDGPGFSGTGYVTGFDSDDDLVEFGFEGKSGLWELRLRYACPNGGKGYELSVNGENGSGMLTAPGAGFHWKSAGKFLLADGPNTIAVRKGWGWWDLDAIELVPTTSRPPVKPPKKLADPAAGTGAVALMSGLVDLYGEKTLSGQQDFPEIEYARSVTGREPAVGAFDLMDYSPSRIEHGSDPGDHLDRIIEWGRNGRGIVSLSWHWNAPSHLPDVPGREWWRGFYTDATGFDLGSALATPESEEYRLLLRDMDAIAGHLRRLQDAGIPVLWRPLHEAQGGWFWWGSRGPDPFVRLWRLMFERYTRLHGLHNLVWVYTSSPDPAGWYPGDNYVDVVGADIYSGPEAGMSAEWEALRSFYGDRKLLALSETGNLPVPAKMRAYQVRWSWFSVWSGHFLRDIPAETVRSVYGDPDMVTRDELPGLLEYR